MATPTSANDVLLVYGPLGVMAALGVAFARSTISHLYEEIKELKSQREEMVQTLLQVVPLMQRSTEIHEKRQSADDLARIELERIAARQSELIAKIDGIVRELGIKS